MTEEKGLDGAVADKIGDYVKLKGGPELIATLRATELSGNKSAKIGLDEMELLFKYLEVFGIVDKVSSCPKFTGPSIDNRFCSDVI
jgi:histidyl-tRNA synthetase